MVMPERNLNDIMVMSQAEKQAISEVINRGSSTVNDDYVSDIVTALIKAEAATFDKAMTVICNDSKLRKNIVIQIENSVQQVIASVDQFTQKGIDNAVANSEVLRSIMKDNDLAPEQFKSCLIELRGYMNDSIRLAADAKASHEHVVNQQQQTVSDVAVKNNAGRDAAMVVGGVTIGSGLTLLLLKILKRI